MSAALRVPLPADHLSWEKAGLFILGSRFPTPGGGPPRIVTQSGPARGSKWRLCPSRAKSFQTCPKSVHGMLKGPQILPKSCPNPPQTVPKSIRKAPWSSSWTRSCKKFDFERSKNDPEAPKSDQKRPQGAQKRSQTVPKPSQMDLHKINFCSIFFQLQIGIDLFMIFH